MSEKRVRLPSGAEMSVVHLEPPVPAALAEPVADLVVGSLNEGFLPDILRGRLVASALGSGEEIELDGRRLRLLTCFIHEPPSHQDTKDDRLKRYDEKGCPEY